MFTKSYLSVILIILFLIFIGNIYADIPGTMTYQGWLRDSANEPITDSLPMAFTIYDSEYDGTPIWGESHPSVGIDSGTFSVVLGLQNPLDPDDFDDAERWLELYVNGETISPRVRITAMPFAVRAGAVENFNPGMNNTDSGSYNFIAGDSNTIISDYCSIAGGFGNYAEAVNLGDTLPPDTTPKLYEPGGGGKGPGCPIWIFGEYCSVTGCYSTITNGFFNNIEAPWCFIGTGFRNRIDYDFADGRGPHSAIVSGYRNVIEHRLCAVVGGSDNVLKQRLSFVGMGYEDTLYDATNVIVGGVRCITGTNNGDSDDAAYATIVNGGECIADGYVSFIGNGHRAINHGRFSFIGNGVEDTIWAPRAFIGTGYWNTIGEEYDTSGYLSAIVSGNNNYANAHATFIGSGAHDTVIADYAVIVGGLINEATGFGSVIGGGRENYTANNYSTVSGGSYNAAIEAGSVVSGGSQDTASGYFSFIGGGNHNIGSGDYSVIGGGQDNTINGYFGTLLGGSENTVGGNYCTAGGGLQNSVSGTGATVPGGRYNSATGQDGFAAGYRARSNHNGTYVWADNTESDFISTNTGQYLIRAANGFGINLNDPTEDLDVLGTGRLRGIQDAPPDTMNFVVVDANGKLWKGGLTSSKRFKKNIRGLGVDANSIYKMEPVRFQWKSSGAEDIGLIAEDVEKILPELVIYDDQGLSSGVKYNKLPVYLLAAIKELKSNLEQSNNEIEVLKERIESLEKAIEVSLSKKENNSTPKNLVQNW